MGARSAGVVLTLLTAIGAAGYWLGTRSGLPPAMPAASTSTPDPLDLPDPADPANEAPIRAGDTVEALSAEGWEAARVVSVDGDQARVDYVRADLPDESLDVRLLQPRPSSGTAAPAASAAPTAAAGAVEGGEMAPSAITQPPPPHPCALPPFERAPLGRVPPPDKVDGLVRALRHTLECPALDPRLRANGFASMSLAVVRSRPDPGCPGFHAGMLEGRWEAHRDWALQQDPATLGADIATKLSTAWNCGLRSQGARHALHAELLRMLDATAAGSIQRVPDFVDGAGQDAGGIALVAADGEYLGCFRDSSDLDLDGHLERSAQNTPQRCIATCIGLGFRFAAVQYGESCLCGDRYGRHGSADNCDYPCTGDPAQTCGGYSANAVYATGLSISDSH